MIKILTSNYFNSFLDFHSIFFFQQIIINDFFIKSWNSIYDSMDNSPHPSPLTHLQYNDYENNFSLEYMYKYNSTPPLLDKGLEWIL